MRTKTLMEYLVENDYSAFLRFVHSDKVLSATDTDQENFYTRAPHDWAMTLVNSLPPSPSIEKTIVKYQDEEVLSLLAIKWKLYPRTIRWAFEEGTSEDAEKILAVIKEKTPELEVSMLKRAELELFKEWLNKFGELEDEAEKLINDDIRLTTLKSYYIDWELSRSR